MMRVGTQRRSKSSSSPNATYRQSPTSNSRSSPSHNSALKPPSYSPFRPSPSPTFGETQKFAQDYHQLQVERERGKFSPRTISPNSYAPRSPSPTFAHRTQSPNFGTHSPSFGTHSPNFRTQSPDYISSKKLNDRRYLSGSPKNDYDSNYTNKMSAMRLSESRSPAFIERSSPEYSYTNSSRYEKRVSETHTTNNSGFDRDGIDTSPIVKVSSVSDRPTARRDSWDAIAKTRNMLSHRSLESVANLTESQLNTELNRKREHEYNEQSRHSQKYSNNIENYNSAERSYGSIQKPYRNGVKNGGAAAIKVQPVPDGVLGKPVEFESK